MTNRYGSDSPWNTIFVISELNSGYKIFKFEKNGREWKKQIGYETLTGEEYNMCDEKHKKIYNAINDWREYVNMRGACMSYEFSKEKNQKIDETIKEMYAIADRNIPIILSME